MYQINDNYYIQPLSRDDLLKLYESVAPLHFPANELRPLANIQSLLNRNGYEGLGLYRREDSELLGYALFIRVPDVDVVLLDFYAILEPYRCLGVGSTFLKGIRDHYATLPEIAGILIETEDLAFAADAHEQDIRSRRNAFYEKNGAYMTTIVNTVFGVPFSILFLPAPREGTQLRDKLELIYRFALSDALYEQHVKWRA